jgi:hypothetical protein
MLLGLLIGSFLLLPYSQDIGPNAVRMGEVISNRRMDLLKRQRGIAEGDFLGARAFLVIAYHCLDPYPGAYNTNGIVRQKLEIIF